MPPWAGVAARCTPGKVQKTNEANGLVFSYGLDVGKC